MKESIEEILENDDGTLAFLHIPRDENNRSFNCDQTNQQKLVNTTFWVVDYIDNIHTKYGDQMLIRIKDNKNDEDSKSRKFFTGSKDIRYVIQKIAEAKKFPRRVTMRAQGNRYYLE